MQGEGDVCKGEGDVCNGEHIMCACTHLHNLTFRAYQNVL